MHRLSARSKLSLLGVTALVLAFNAAARRRRPRRHRCIRPCRYHRGYKPHRIDRRLDHGNPVRARLAAKNRRSGYDEPLSAGRAAGETECRLHAATLRRGCARALADACPGLAGLGAERDHRHSATVESSFRLRAGQISGDGIVEKIRIVAQSTAASERGECLARRVRDELAPLDGMRAQIRQRLKVAFVLSLAGNRPMIAGRATAADGIIGLAGAANDFADFDGYKLVNDEAIVAAKPEVVLGLRQLGRPRAATASQAWSGGPRVLRRCCQPGTHFPLRRDYGPELSEVMQRGERALSADTVFAQPALAMTPAAERQALVSMDGLFLLGFGPRTARAARELAAHLYPDIDTGAFAAKQDADAPRCDQ